MRILFLPFCPDVRKLHDYIKTNFAIEETAGITLDGTYSYEGIGTDIQTEQPLAKILEGMYFSQNSPIQQKNVMRLNPKHKSGYGVTYVPKWNSTYVVLPDGYVLTAAQIDTIEAYAVNPT